MSETTFVALTAGGIAAIVVGVAYVRMRPMSQANPGWFARFAVGLLGLAIISALVVTSLPREASLIVLLTVGGLAALGLLWAAWRGWSQDGPTTTTVRFTVGFGLTVALILLRLWIG